MVYAGYMLFSDTLIWPILTYVRLVFGNYWCWILSSICPFVGPLKCGSPACAGLRSLQHFVSSQVELDPLDELDVSWCTLW